jgi:hypothetical protein
MKRFPFSYRNNLAVALVLMTLLISACGSDEESGLELKLDFS